MIRVGLELSAITRLRSENASLVDRFDKAGADSILVVTPFYSAPPQRGAISYFTNLGARTKRPLLIYHIPARAAFTLTVDTLAAIKDRVPHFSGLKNTDTDIGFVTGAFARLGRDFRIFAGLELPTTPIRLTHSPSRCSVIPVAGIKLGIGRRLCVASDAEQRTEGVERVEAPVEPKREFVEVGL